jgi:hypothetical protein
LIVTDRQEELGRWMEERLKRPYYQDGAIYIGYEVNGIIKCVSSFRGYNEVAMTVGVAVDNQRLYLPFLKFSFWYPFCQLNVKKLISIVNEGNNASVRINSHMGFVEETRIKDACKDGDVIIFSMTKEQCKYI